MSLPENPLTRRETYLAKAAGQDVTLPEEDLTREEQYLRAIAEGGGGSGGTQADWSQTNTTAPDYIKNKPTLGTAASKDSTDAVTENSTDLVESGAVKMAIDTAVSSVYKPAGSKAADEFIADLLIEANLGKVYNASTSGTTTENFVEGAGKVINIGDNVVIVDVGTANEASYKFDLLAGFVDLSGKADKVSSATAGDLAALDASGNLTDSGSKAADFIISGSATGTAITLTDSADARAQGITIYGRSEVVEGEIKSVGDDGLTVQTTGKNLVEETISGANVTPTGELITHSSYDAHIAKVIKNHTYTITTDEAEKVIAFYTNKPVLTDKSYNQSRILQYSNTIIAPINGYIVFRSSAGYVAPQIEEGSTATAYEPYRSTSADYTTGLPLCSIPDTTIHDELNAGKEVVKQCGEVELDDLTFTYANNLFSATVTGAAAGAALCEKYTYKAITSALSELANGEFTMYSDSGTVKVYINDTNYSDAATFTTAVTGVKLIYPLETPTTTPLTDTEISAFRALRTFDSTTNINITDEPEYSIDYLKNTDNGEAVSRVVDQLQGTEIKVFTYTGTGTVNHSTTFPEAPTMVLAMFGQHTFSSNTWSVSSRPFVWGVRPVFVDWCAVGGTSNGNQMMPATYNGKEISFSGMAVSDPGAALNAEGETYTVYYI